MASPSQASRTPSLATRPDVWRGDELAAAGARVISTGHRALDAQLPGGGWPLGTLTEVLQAAPQAQVWRLLLPALVLALRSRGGHVVLVGAPQMPFAPALAAEGLAPDTLLWIRADAAVARSWACEQALRCADVAAVLAWLPEVRSGDLRRLQLAAARHEHLLFVFRPEAQARLASPAPLRLRLRLEPDDGRAGIDAGELRCGSGGGFHGRPRGASSQTPADHAPRADRMNIDMLKRRGPPLTTPLVLPERSERLTALLCAALHRRRQRQAPGHGDAAEIAKIPSDVAVAAAEVG